MIRSASQRRDVLTQRSNRSLAAESLESRNLLTAIDLSLGVAAQSTQLEGFVAENALDDVANFTHTLAEDENPVWQVLLPAYYIFDDITVFNRGASEGTLSCCPSRLRDITIQIVDFDGDVTTDFTGGKINSTSELLNPENTLGGGVNTVGPISLTHNGDGRSGNLIRVFRTPDPDLSGSGGVGNSDEGSVLSIDLVLADGVLAGDADGNGSVEFADFLLISSNFGKGVRAGTLGDLDENGRVEFADFLILSAFFGQSEPTASDVGASGE